MQKTSSFLLSGILSISFYILICILVIYYVASPKAKTYTIKSEATVLELDVIIEKSDKKRVEKKVDKIVEKKQEVIKETSSSAEKKPDLKSLFGKVKIKEAKVVEKEVNNVKKSSDPKIYKAKFEKEKKSTNLKVDSLLKDTRTTTNTTSKSSSKKGETDEYYSKVRALLDRFIPTTREENLKSVVLVIINRKGEFDYKIVSYSNNTNFDESLKAFLDEQKSIIYPIPKKNKTVKINVDFKSEG